MRRFWSKAFTLIEVLVAMLVLAIGLLGLAGITVVVLRSNRLAQEMSDATTIASDLIEILKSKQTFPNCTSLLSQATSANQTDCKILALSGVASLPDASDYLPANQIDGDDGVGTSCAIAGVVSGDRALDIVYANYLEAVSLTAQKDSSPCTLSDTSLPAGAYVRYYRTVASGTNGNKISVVVLWRDRFGKWRNVHLSTIKTQ